MIGKTPKKYFTADYILSKGAIFNIVLSDRSDGKTFDCKARALKAYEEDKSQTVYLRRYKTEIIVQMYETFFDEVIETEEYARFREWKFRGSKQGVEVKTSENADWDYIVYFMPLTVSGKRKSTLNVKRIKMIDYDEFVPLDERYLRNEIILLLEFYKSVDRERYTTKLIILGNKVTPFNPLFDFFNIDLTLNINKLRMYRNGALAVQIFGISENRKAESKTKFNDLVAGTEYDAYNNGGILYNLNIRKANKANADYYCSFISENGEGSVWYNGECFIISEYQRKDGFVICDKMYNTGRKEYSIKFGRFKNMFREQYNIGNLRFESDEAFHRFEPILKKCNI